MFWFSKKIPITQARDLRNSPGDIFSKRHKCYCGRAEVHPGRETILSQHSYKTATVYAKEGGGDITITLLPTKIIPKSF